ncbi:tRNA(Met) cytidine acetyltransferase [Vibrio vulnificus]|nr:tRNA(Met) cytidine acetyltransferase [Vibrio vulnificus]
MDTQLQSLLLLQQQARLTGQRYGVVLHGDENEQNSLLRNLFQKQNQQRVFVMGEGIIEPSLVTQVVTIKQGQRLLGQECQLLIIDCREQFDANSFSAACGSLCGGGLLLILPPSSPQESVWHQWFCSRLEQLIQLLPNHSFTQNESLFVVDDIHSHRFEQQNIAVALIQRVVTGHRKRPLLLTADRGRGKSSALGIASGELMSQRKIHIVITAPSIGAVEPVFQHAQKVLTNGQVSRGKMTTENASLEFVAPDELLQRLPNCDLLLVDEAAAIPLPMLKRMVEYYHRSVFSTTIHGYEGCGRGFTAKFLPWLETHRPGMKHCHLDYPIRWNPNDALEHWLNQTFLLDAEITQVETVDHSALSLRLVDKDKLLLDHTLMRECFALLVNAHYQTSPNDLMQLLSDDASQLWIAQINDAVIGCLLTVEEGGLESDLIEQVQLGKRRPSGHLIPISLANHLGLSQAAAQRSLRIMRIAVHPQHQSKGIGQAMLTQLELQLKRQFGQRLDYLSTSFGATDALLRFWAHRQYQAVRIGFSRDAASGCHALMMVKPLTGRAQSWMMQAEQMFDLCLPEWLSSSLRDLETDVVRALLPLLNGRPLTSNQLNLIRHYAKGGNSFESVQVWLKQWLLSIEAEQVDELLIRKVLQNRKWTDCAREFSLPGRKQVEAQLRQVITILLSQH